ncbi:MAG TPA: hypothetical protein VLE49_09625 [Anaerolineales bacterium]|nr:hypothetical protein [Anaerolineales bacterium]
MSAKPAKRNWNDVQTAIATAAIVTTLGMWNLFAAPAKTVTAQAEEPTLPPAEPPTEPPVAGVPTAIPYVKVMFTPNAPLPPTVAPQTGQQVQAPQKKKKHKGNGGGGGGGGASAAPVSQTKSS